MWFPASAVAVAIRRGISVGNALLNAAVSHAREHGAPAIEGHPVDVDQLTAARVSGAALYTGTLAMFATAGFAEIGRTVPSQPVMRVQF